MTILLDSEESFLAPRREEKIVGVQVMNIMLIY